MNQPFSWSLFNRMPVTGILRNMPLQQVEALAGPYLEAGLTTLEITMNSTDATDAIASLAGAYNGRLNVGAGTVCTMDALEKACNAGAQFIVTPIVDETVIKACVDRDIPVFAGAYTPTEIYQAWNAGATMVKVFPASKLGPAYIKEVLAPLNDVKLMPTGGVTLENFTDFLEAGARAVGIGSHLINKDSIKEGEWEALKMQLSAFVMKYNGFLNRQ